MSLFASRRIFLKQYDAGEISKRAEVFRREWAEINNVGLLIRRNMQAKPRVVVGSELVKLRVKSTVVPFSFKSLL